MDINGIKQMSEVARINMSEEELKNLGDEIENLLSYFSRIQEIDTHDVAEGPAYMHDLHNTFREDEVKGQDEETKESIRAEFTKREGNLLTAPKSLK